MGRDLRRKFYLSEGQLRRALEKTLGTKIWSSHEGQGVERGRRRGDLVLSPGDEETWQSNWRTSGHGGQESQGKELFPEVSEKEVENYMFLNWRTKQSEF